MANVILLPTGGPRILYDVGSIEVSLDLPVPDFNRHMEAVVLDESRYVRRHTGEVRMVGAARGRRSFAWGYECLPDDLAETLIEVLAGRRVRLVPRTATPGDPSGAFDEEETIAVRITSDIPHTRHLTLGYRIEIEAIEVDPAHAPLDLSYGASGHGAPGAGAGAAPAPAPGPVPPPIGGGEALPDCTDTRAGTATMPTGGLVAVAPDPPLLHPLNNTQDAQTTVTLTERDGSDMRLYVSALEDFHFDVTANNPPPGDTLFSWGVIQRDLLGDCLKCWRRNTWHHPESPCAPFAEFPARADVPLGNLGACATAYDAATRTFFVMHGRTNPWATGHDKFGRVGMYAVDTDTWTFTPKLPNQPFQTYSDVRENAILTFLGGKLYYFGGFRSDTGWPTQVYSMTPPSGAWTEEAFTFNVSVGGGGLDWSGYAVLSGECIIFGGRGPLLSGNGRHAGVWKFNGASFTSIGSMEDNVWQGGAVQVPGTSKVFFLGGLNGPGTSTGGTTQHHKIYSYDGASLVKEVFETPAAPALVQMSGHGAVQYGTKGVIYALVTGVTGASWWRLDIEKETWYKYPRRPNHWPGSISDFRRTVGNVQNIDGMMFVAGGGDRYHTEVYIPYEAFPLNPFTGDAAE